MSTLRYGVLGGSFDPPHYGHLAMAETARVQLGLAQILFVPAAQPPHKTPCSPAEQRVALLAAAIADNPAFTLSRVDLDRPGPHYTVDMLRLLQAQHPDVSAWYFLMGEDSLRDFPTWRDPEGILAQAYLAVMPRLGERADVVALRARYEALNERLVWLDVPTLNISSSDLRRRVHAGLPIRYLVPSAVEAYIQAQGLYRE